MTGIRIRRAAAATIVGALIMAALIAPGYAAGEGTPTERELRLEKIVPPIAPGVRFPNAFLTQWWRAARQAGVRPFIECEPVSKTCDRGVIDRTGRNFVGAVVPDDDRTHVVRNIAWFDERPHGDTSVTDFGTGRIYSTGADRYVAHFTRDFPPECPGLARDADLSSPPFLRGGKCDRRSITAHGEPN